MKRSRNLEVDTQDLEFEQACVRDLYKDLEKQRDLLRQELKAMFQYFIPSVAEETLTLVQTRLLRCFRLAPQQCSAKEKQEAQLLMHQLNHLHNGGSLNLTPQQESSLNRKEKLFCLHPPGSSFPFGLESEKDFLINEEIGLVDALISWNGQTWQYPLTRDESERFLGRLHLSGVDPSRLPRLHVPTLEKLKRSAQATRQAYLKKHKSDMDIDE